VPRAIKSTVVVLLAVVACAQQPTDKALDRTLPLIYTERPQDVQEIAAVVRGVTDVPVLSTDPVQRAVMLRGTADQVAMAEWLLHELDEAGSRRPQSSREYRAPGGSGDSVQVFYPRHIESPIDLEETRHVARGLGDIRRVFTYQPAKALIVRGTTDQVALAAWLYNELDKRVDRAPPGGRSHTSASYEYRSTDPDGGAVQVCYFANTEPRDRMEAASLIRGMTGIRRTFFLLGWRAVVVRGSVDQIGLAEWLFSELDDPAKWPPAAKGTQDSPVREYRVPGSSDELVRIV